MNAATAPQSVQHSKVDSCQSINCRLLLSGLRLNDSINLCLRILEIIMVANLEASLISLPSELILHIAKFLRRQRDISRLSRTHRRLHILLTDLLLEVNITRGRSSALLWAARNNHYRLARRLVKLGSEVQNPDKTLYWGTPLDYAVLQKNQEICNLLLNAGADPTRLLMGSSPLEVALIIKDEKIAQAMIDRMGSVDAIITQDGKTALHIACKMRLSNTVKYLLKAGADVNFVGKTRDQESPLRTLFYQERLDDNALGLLKYILDSGAQLDASTHSLAIRHGDARVRYLFSGRTCIVSDEDIGKPRVEEESTDETEEASTLIHFFRNLSRREAKVELDVGITDDSHFPLLNDHCHQLPEVNDVWKDPNIERVLANLAFHEDEIEAPSQEQAPVVDVEPFPELPGIRKHANADVDQFWAQFKQTKESEYHAYEVGKCDSRAVTSIQPCATSPKVFTTDPFPRLSSHPKHAKNASPAVWASFRKRGGLSESRDAPLAMAGLGAVLTPGKEIKRGPGKKKQWNKLQL